MAFETREFPYPSLFEEAWEAVRDELHALNAQVLDLHRKAEPIEEFVALLEQGPNGWTPSWQAGASTVNRDWLTYALWYAGRLPKGAAEAFPVTAALLSGVPGCKVAAFSWMRPLTVIGPHDHPDMRDSPIRILHLGLDVVPGRSFLCVDGRFREELPGRTLMFDGSYVHFAVNASSEDRVILYAEFDVSQW